MVMGQVVIGRQEVEAEAVNECGMGRQSQSISLRVGSITALI